MAGAEFRESTESFQQVEHGRPAARRAFRRNYVWGMTRQSPCEQFAIVREPRPTKQCCSLPVKVLADGGSHFGGAN